MTIFTIFKYFLYAALGVSLSIFGISILEKPVEFLILLGLTSAIDITSKLEIV
jgi:hypothetical protein